MHCRPRIPSDAVDTLPTRSRAAETFTSGLNPRTAALENSWSTGMESDCIRVAVAWETQL